MKRHQLSVLALILLAAGLSGRTLGRTASFSNPTIDKFAKVLTAHSLDLHPGNKLLIRTTPDAEELVQAVYREALQIGAHVYVDCEFSWLEEVFYQHATDEQLKFVLPVERFMAEDFDALLRIDAPANSRALSEVDPSRMQTRKTAQGEVFKILMKRSAGNELRWHYTVYPTAALAQEAEMSLSDYQDFVYKACKFHLPDPVSGWRELAIRQRELATWLGGKDKVELKGPNIDLTLSIKGRTFVVGEGKDNLPDGEIYTSPVEDSASGWVRFSYPAIFQGREVEDVKLWFENGRVVREEAAKGKEFLNELLNIDPGARILGELGIGTNYDITRFSKHMLFDEKMGGTIHLAVGGASQRLEGRTNQQFTGTCCVTCLKAKFW